MSGAITKGPWELRGPTRVYGNLQRDQNSTADLVATTVRGEDALAITILPELLTALEEQIALCFDPLCQMCVRHEGIIAKSRGQS